MFLLAAFEVTAREGALKLASCFVPHDTSTGDVGYVAL